MKNIFWVGIFLIIAGAIMPMSSGTSGSYLCYSGLVFLFSYLSLYSVKKSVTDKSMKWKVFKILGIVLSGVIILFGFTSKMLWGENPFGFIVSISGCIWSFVFYYKNKASWKKQNI